MKSLNKKKFSIKFIIQDLLLVSVPIEVAKAYFNSSFTEMTNVLHSVESIPSPFLQLHTIYFNASNIYNPWHVKIRTKVLEYQFRSSQELCQITHRISYSPFQYMPYFKLPPSFPEEYRIHKVCPITKQVNKYNVKNLTFSQFYQNLKNQLFTQKYAP